jgi:sugar phosphate isomerase/epimerase
VRLACSTASFPEDRPQIAVAKVAWAGYGAVELAVDPHALPDETEAQRWLRANELELAAVFAGAVPAGEPPDPEALAPIGRAAALTRALDGGLVVVRAPETGTLAGLANSLSLLDSALSRLSLDLCVVNAAGTLLALPDALAELWATRGGKTPVAIDPGEALVSGWDPLDFDGLPALPRHVYLDDAADGRLVPPGQGTLDPERLGRLLRERGYAGSVSLLLRNANPWEVEPVVRELRESAAVWLETE